MDPDAALGSFWRAYERGDYEDAVEYGEALTGWLGRHGFPPAWHVHGGKPRFDTALRAAKRKAR